MNVVTVLALSSLQLVWISGGAASMEAAPTFSAILTYPAGIRSSTTSPTFHAPNGSAYRFRLDPQRDVDGNLVVFELFMERPNPGSRGSNLLDPTGRLHGYQKWFFAASDFARGPHASTYGDSRTIDLPSLGQSVRIDVVRSGVRRTRAIPNHPANYRFTSLVVRVVTRPRAGRAP